MRRTATLLILFFCLTRAHGQNCQIKLTGHVQDDDTKETGKQLTTNEKGDFIFTNLCSGKYTLVVTHISFDTVIREIIISKDLHLDILMPMPGIHWEQ